jgi:hypothetical protein
MAPALPLLSQAFPMRTIFPIVIAAATVVSLGCGKKEEAPAPIAGTPAATSAPVQGAPGANAGISYESRMPSNVKNSMQTKGAPIK